MRKEKKRLLRLRKESAQSFDGKGTENSLRSRFSRNNGISFPFRNCFSDLKPQFSKNIYKVNSTERIAPVGLHGY
jgi:hypothetical protein